MVVNLCEVPPWNDSPSLDVTSCIHSPGLGMSRLIIAPPLAPLGPRLLQSSSLFLGGCPSGCGHLGILGASRGSTGSWRAHLCLVGSYWGLVQVIANISARTGFNHPNQAFDGPKQGRGAPKTPCTPKTPGAPSSRQQKEEPRGVQCSFSIYGQPGGRAAAQIQTRSTFQSSCILGMLEELP